MGRMTNTAKATIDVKAIAEADMPSTRFARANSEDGDFVRRPAFPSWPRDGAVFAANRRLLAFRLLPGGFANRLKARPGRTCSLFPRWSV